MEISNTKKFNVVDLKEGTIFSSSMSDEVAVAIFEANKKSSAAFRLYLKLRSEYASFVAQEQSKHGQYDNTLTCYYKTNEALQESTGLDKKTFERAFNELKLLGLVICLPFTKDSKQRHNIVVLDYALKDYNSIVTECARRLRKFIAENRRSAEAQKSLDKLLPFMETQSSNLGDEMDSDLNASAKFSAHVNTQELEEVVPEIPVAIPETSETIAIPDPIPSPISLPVRSYRSGSTPVVATVRTITNTTSAVSSSMQRLIQDSLMSPDDYLMTGLNPFN